MSNFKDASQKPAQLPSIKWYAPGSTVGVDFVGAVGEAFAVIEFVEFQQTPKVVYKKISLVSLFLYFKIIYLFDMPT